MKAKRLFILNPAEYQLFTKLCNPPPLLVVHAGAESPSWNKHDGAETFWRALGNMRGFDWETVEPAEGMHKAFFRAMPT